MFEARRVDEAFTLAGRAAWAGDLEACRFWIAALREMSTRLEGAGEWSPPALLLRAAVALEARLAGRELPPAELVADTGHFRGVVWQTGRREFELRAYLADPDWEEEMYRRAHLAARAKGATPLGDDYEDPRLENDVRAGQPRDARVEGEADDGPGVVWEESAEGLLCEVTVGDLGLILVKSIWVRDGAPESGVEVTRRLGGILLHLEAPDPTVVDPGPPAIDGSS